MEAVERIEKGQEEAHETSFIPRVVRNQAPNGTVGPPEAVTSSTPSRTNSAQNLGLFRRRRTDEPQNPAEAALDLPDEEGYLPCHYFDYIAGTSTGGSVFPLKHHFIPY
jgi:hypothetical protein